jgi:hypothetical protein
VVDTADRDIAVHVASRRDEAREVARELNERSPEIDRHGRTVMRDRFGMRYVIDAHHPDLPFYITDCCDASGKGSDGGVVVCRACYREVDIAIGGIPEPVAADVEPVADDRHHVLWSAEVPDDSR